MRARQSSTRGILVCVHRRNLDGYSSSASRVISAFRTFDTGQFFSASFAIFTKASLSRLGTRARNVRAERLILYPVPSDSRLTAASVLSWSGVNPAACIWTARAIVKQPAWAAAMSSSGFVPFSFSKRVVNEYGVFDRTPESVESSPFPALPVPRHTAVALLIIDASL